MTRREDQPQAAFVPAQPGLQAVVVWAWDEDGVVGASHYVVPLVGFRVLYKLEDPYARPIVDFVVPGDVTGGEQLALLLHDGSVCSEGGDFYDDVASFAEVVRRTYADRLARRAAATQEGAA